MTTTPDLKDLLHQCLDPKTDDDSIKEALAILTKEEYRELIFQEFYSIYIKRETNRKWDWENVSFLHKYLEFNQYQALVPCLRVLEKMGDVSFTIDVLGHIHIKPHHTSLIQVLVDNYIPKMVDYDWYDPVILEHEFLKEPQIETLIQGIEKTKGKTLHNLQYLLNNKNMNATQLDRLSVLLKLKGRFHFNAGLLACHPNLDISLIKNHLRISGGFNTFIEKETNKCKQIVENNQNKSNMHKMILLECLPCLAAFGLEANPLDVAIEVLEDVL